MIKTPPFTIELAKILLLTNVGHIKTTIPATSTASNGNDYHHPVLTMAKMMTVVAITDKDNKGEGDEGDTTTCPVTMQHPWPMPWWHNDKDDSGSMMVTPPPSIDTMPMANATVTQWQWGEDNEGDHHHLPSGVNATMMRARARVEHSADTVCLQYMLHKVTSQNFSKSHHLPHPLPCPSSSVICLAFLDALNLILYLLPYLQTASSSTMTVISPL